MRAMATAPPVDEKSTTAEAVEELSFKSLVSRPSVHVWITVNMQCSGA